MKKLKGLLLLFLINCVLLVPPVVLMYVKADLTWIFISYPVIPFAIVGTYRVINKYFN